MSSSLPVRILLLNVIENVPGYLTLFIHESLRLGLMGPLQTNGGALWYTLIGATEIEQVNAPLP